MLFLFRSNFVFQSYILRVVVRTARTKHNKKSDPKRESIPEICVFFEKKNTVCDFCQCLSVRF